MADSDRVPGVISAQEAYTLDEVKLRLRIGDSTWWQLRDRGLRHVILGKRRMILGSDLLKVLGEMAECRASE